MTSVTNIYIDHFNILLLLFIICCHSVVKTNAEMSRFRISTIVNTPIPISNLCDRDQPTSQTDRQTEDTTMHRMVKCILPILLGLRDLEACSLN